MEWFAAIVMFFIYHSITSASSNLDGQRYLRRNLSSKIPTLPALNNDLRKSGSDIIERAQHYDNINGIPIHYENLADVLPSEISMVGKEQVYSDPGSEPSRLSHGIKIQENMYTERLQKELLEILEKLESTNNLYQTARAANIKWDKTAKVFQEVLRIMKNEQELYKLENSQIMLLLQDEKLKSRMHQSELFETRKRLKEAQCLLNGTILLSNATEDWDLHETVYNGERWARNWDNRHPRMGENLTVTATRNIFLLRHGHYEYSEPEEKIEMSPLGVQQMEALGKALASLHYNWSKTFVVSSKHRTQQAAGIAAKFLPGMELQPTNLIWSCPSESDKERRQKAFNKFIHRASPEQKHDSYELIMTHSSIIRYFVDRFLIKP
ncbi:uncharacterized protein LOC129596650 isoform X2 [Paramacrobiotus metropolitanus]|uniref:uncharacterized protein LOC129596650 isoform X2 n=1 Tax=Paramacrobiotus metropolitanus TaxID=2943436 RepID=UPI0024460741|nr:uncharacterized protein LOC129596650 isoform X2 [Paramacrobiotus metropolitanus]